MLSARLRRRYGLPLQGETGLDGHHEWLLQHLDARHSFEEMQDLLQDIPALKPLVKATPQKPASNGVKGPATRGTLEEGAIRRKYGIPPDGPTSINRMRVRELVLFERKLNRSHPHSLLEEKGSSWRANLNAIIVEQRFISAWTHNGFRQPGVRLVRGATPEEDARKIDAVMELENGRTYLFQIKAGPYGSFQEHAQKGIVMARIMREQHAEEMRRVAIEAIIEYEKYKCRMNKRH